MMNNDNYFSLDRLVEFGLGMGVAKQMISIMNESMQSMYIPGSSSPMQSVTSKIYYVAIDGKSVGPLNENQLMEYIAKKKVVKDTLVWMPGMVAWKTIESVPEVLKLIALTPPLLNCL